VVGHAGGVDDVDNFSKRRIETAATAEGREERERHGSVQRRGTLTMVVGRMTRSEASGAGFRKETAVDELPHLLFMAEVKQVVKDRDDRNDREMAGMELVPHQEGRWHTRRGSSSSRRWRGEVFPSLLSSCSR
jgi:hypothetical protein